MKHELLITQKALDALHKLGRKLLLEEILNSIDVTVTRNSNFFEATDFLLEDSTLCRVDRVRFLDAFMEQGGVVRFNQQVYSFCEVLQLLEYLLSHRFISEEEYASYKTI